jgi:hypothetical protein
MLRSRLILTIQGDEPVFQEVSFNTLDTADGGLLNSVRRLLSDIFIPALRASSHGWGELEGLQDASSIRQEFLSSLEGFVGILSGAQNSLKEKVRRSKWLIKNRGWPSWPSMGGEALGLMPQYRGVPGPGSRSGWVREQCGGGV